MTRSGGGVPKKTYKKMWVESSAGSTLAQSRRVDGANAPFARNATGINEQVILHNKKPKTPGSGGSELTDFLTEVAVAAAVMGAQAFIDKGIPAIRQKLANRRAAKLTPPPAPDSVSDVAISVPDENEPTTTEVVSAGTEIDTQQWYQLFFETVAHSAASRAHEAISAERWASLASARVVNDEETQALANAMRELSPEHLRERLDRVLKQHPHLSSEDPATVMKMLFGGDEPLPVPIPVAGAHEEARDVPQAFETPDPGLDDEDEVDRE